MKNLLVVLLFLAPSLAWADQSSEVLTDALSPRFTSVCIQKQIATTGDNRLGTAMTVGKRYLIYCYDASFNGVACECLQGNATVDVSSVNGIKLKAGAEYIIKATTDATQLSCQSVSGTPYVDACPIN